MSQRKQYEVKVKQKLEDLEREIDKLKDQVEEMAEDLVSEEHENLQKLQALSKKTRGKFEELLEASDEAFETMQDNLEEYWASVGREMKAFDVKVNDD
ncbi:MAG: hypothetical protein GKR91_11125 [Pseudomonadales bacterium]|nr:hypothetical protein [Pseudomonadales bacterium]